MSVKSLGEGLMVSTFTLCEDDFDLLTIKPVRSHLLCCSVNLPTWISAWASASLDSCTCGRCNRAGRRGRSRWWRTMWGWTGRQTFWMSAWPAGWSLPRTSTRTPPWQSPTGLSAPVQPLLWCSSGASAGWSRPPFQWRRPPVRLRHPPHSLCCAPLLHEHTLKWY